MKRKPVLIVTLLLLTVALFSLFMLLIEFSPGASPATSDLQGRVYHHCLLQRIADGKAQDDQACRDWTDAVFEANPDALWACQRAEPIEQDGLSACLNRAGLRPERPGSLLPTEHAF